MHLNPKLVILAVVAALGACSAPQEKPRLPLAASDTARTETSSITDNANAGIVEKSAPRQEAADAAVEKQPPDHPATVIPENAPALMRTPEPAAPPKAASAPETMSMSTAESKAATPPKPMTVVADTAPREFTVTVGEKDPSHPNYGRGHDMGFIVDGAQGKELVLTRGVKYTFLVDTNVQHDFYFTTSPIGRGAGTVTDGIKGQFTYRGVVIFTPTATTPDVVYYECRNHPYMGGKIHIANAGDKVTLYDESAEAPQNISEKRVVTVTAAQVKQKLSYASMMLDSSPSAKRVAAGDNAEAKNLLAQARQQLGGANSALTSGDNAAAMQAVNEALRLVSAAASLVPSEAEQVDYKARYAELLDQLHGFDKAYQKNLARGIKPKSGKELDKAQYDRLVKEAEGLAATEQYEDAVKQIKNANEMLTAALAALLESQTVVYDKNFATPQEEYEFESSRYASYEELIPLAIEQRKPTAQTVAMMDELSKRAKEIHDEGVALAAKGDHKQAVMALQAATERLQQALHLAGVQ